MVTKARTRLGQYFEDNRLQKSDVPKAIVIHELLGLVILLSTWTTAFYFPPSKIRMLQGPIASLERMVPNALRQSMAKNELINSKLGGAYIEASCFRKLVRPLTIPLKMYTTLKLVLLSNEVYCEAAKKVSRLNANLKVQGVQAGVAGPCVREMCKIVEWVNQDEDIKDVSVFKML